MKMITYTRLIWTRIAYACTILAALACCHISVSAQGANDSTKRFRYCIANFNGDAYQDTLVGSRKKEKITFLPEEIRWGRKSSNSDTLPQPKRHKTKITIPNWDDRSVSVSTDRRNSDTLPDLIFYCWGIKKAAGEKEEKKMKIVLLFGQKGLDSINDVRLDLIEREQTSPYKARLLQFGADIIEPDSRTADGTPSYIILKTEDVPEEQEKENPNAVSPYRVDLYPNPASHSISMRVRNIADGDCRLLVRDSRGLIVLEKREHVRPDEEFQIGLESLTSGSYLLSIDTGTATIGPFTFLVVH